MHNGGADDIAKLIEPGRVHRRVYTDPDIFERATSSPPSSAASR